MSARQSHHTLSSYDGRTVHFHHRDQLRRKLVDDQGNAIVRSEAKLGHVAPTPLPTDCSGNMGFQDPMDANDADGDCGSCMAAHSDSEWTYGQGKPGFGPQLVAPVAPLVSQYLATAGGDNGLTQDNLVGPGGIWRVGVAADPKAVIADSLDISVSDVALRRYCIDQFYVVCMGWSVPDVVLSTFRTGISFLSAMTPNPANGHWTPLTDLDPDGNTRVVTWGGWMWFSDAALASVDPEYFVVFSPLQFNAQGYDSHGRHVSEQAAKWKLLGGNGPAVDAVVAMFPAATPTTPPSPLSAPPAPPSAGPPSAGPPPAGPPSAGPPPAGPPPAGPPSAGPPPAGPPSAGPPPVTPSAPPRAPASSSTAPTTKCSIKVEGWECPLPDGHAGACPAVRSDS